MRLSIRCEDCGHQHSFDRNEIDRIYIHNPRFFFIGADRSWPLFRCTECKGRGIIHRIEELTPSTVPCNTCGKPISRERLEALPGAVRCMGCSARAGALLEELHQKPCARCGGRLELREELADLDQFGQPGRKFVICESCGLLPGRPDPSPRAELGDRSATA